jgi:hypothetical protein
VSCTLPITKASGSLVDSRASRGDLLLCEAMNPFSMSYAM